MTDKNCNRLPPPAALAAALSIIVLAAAVRPASAQPSTPRGALSINGGLQTAAGDFSDSVRFGHALFGPEEGSVDARYPGSDDALFDVGGSVRVWRNLAVGASVSRLTRETAADVAGQLPHPFWFDRPRSVSGTAPGLARAETAVHVQALWVIPVGRSVAVTLFGGPTWFNATQDLVAHITFEQAYPFDAATFSGANAGERSASTIGAHAGADVAYYFSERIGIGGMVRFSRGSVALDSPDGDTLKNDVGGMHTSGGLRIRF
ncbi:MAG: hypothetical protein OXF27_02380 [Acidobacteria bacterium]|nr:hypothetical protein [Acidobacteriota bacterium]